MKYFFFALPALASLAAMMAAPPAQAAEAKPRVIVSTDIGGSDPDDFQSMVHYLVYADRFDTEGLISSPPGAGRADAILECLTAYEADYPQLHARSAGYPTAEALRATVRQGATEAQAEEVPPAEISEGAQRIIEQAHAEDSRPLWVLIWGSITDVAQAVQKDPSIKSKLRLYSIGSWNTSQDRKARNYLFDHHADLWWIESDTTFRGMYMGGDQSGDLGNVSFPQQHLLGHGQLGNLFMQKKKDIKMGDTPSVLYLLYGDPDQPGSDHWGGAYVQQQPEARPAYWHDDPQPDLIENKREGARTVNKWREQFLRDWQQRMELLPSSQ